MLRRKGNYRLNTAKTYQYEYKKENKLTKTTSIKGCNVILNFLPESNDKAIETVKSMLLSTYYQDISQKPEGNLAG